MGGDESGSGMKAGGDWFLGRRGVGVVKKEVG